MIKTEQCQQPICTPTLTFIDLIEVVRYLKHLLRMSIERVILTQLKFGSDDHVYLEKREAENRALLLTNQYELIQVVKRVFPLSGSLMFESSRMEKLIWFELD